MKANPKVTMCTSSSSYVVGSSVRDDDGRARGVFEEKDAHLVHLKTRNSTLKLLRPGKGCLRNSYPMRNLYFVVVDQVVLFVGVAIIVGEKKRKTRLTRKVLRTRIAPDLELKPKAHNTTSTQQK